MARQKVTSKRNLLSEKESTSKKQKMIVGVDEIPHPDRVRNKSRSKSKNTSTVDVEDQRFQTSNYRKLYISGAQAIANGRTVDFTSLDQSNATFVREWFRWQRWDGLLGEQELVYPDLVRQFYTHFDHTNKEKEVIHTWVKGVHIELNDKILGKILEIPSTGVHDTCGNKWSTVDGLDPDECMRLVMMDEDAKETNKPQSDSLPMQTRLLHLVVMYTINCREGRISSISYRDLFVMHCILANKRMNMLRMIINFMNYVQTHHNTYKLPCGMWLSKVFRYFNVSLSNEAVEENKNNKINSNTISKSMGYTFDKDLKQWTKTSVKRAPRREAPAGKEAGNPIVDRDDSRGGKEGLPTVRV